MLQLAFVFIVAALIAGVIGFSGLESKYTDIAKILAVLFLVIGAVSVGVSKLAKYF